MSILVKTRSHQNYRIVASWRSAAVILVLSSLGMSASTAVTHAFLPKMVVAVPLAIGFIAVEAGLEYLRVWTAGQQDPRRVVRANLSSAATITIEEARSTAAEGRGGLVGACLDLSVFLAAGLISYSNRETTSLLSSVVFLASLGAAGIALLRMLPIQGHDGGRLLHWYLDHLCGEEDVRDQLSMVVSQVCALLLVFTGLIFASSDGITSMLGIAAIVAGVSAVTTAPRYARERSWIARASQKRIDQLPPQSCPKLSISAPISELMHVLSVERSSMTVVVTNEQSEPVGVISLKKPTIPVWLPFHFQSMPAVAEMLVEFDRVPTLPGDMTVLESTTQMERDHLDVVRCQRRDGKYELLTLKSLRFQV